MSEGLRVLHLTWVYYARLQIQTFTFKSPGEEDNLPSIQCGKTFKLIGRVVRLKNPFPNLTLKDKAIV